MLDIMENSVSPGTTVIVACDFNADLVDIDNVHGIDNSKMFLVEYNLKLCLTSYAGNKTYTFINVKHEIPTHC